MIVKSFYLLDCVHWTTTFSHGWFVHIFPTSVNNKQITDRNVTPINVWLPLKSLRWGGVCHTYFVEFNHFLLL